ncbi:MAG: hypothetical protein LBV06_08765 [Propionibacteriaceae bacterium]|jgi:uncharacterized protein YdbL (DUF1318 family)|nr:hypothetical protein [Propionibacteriaceae bacterium]
MNFTTRIIQADPSPRTTGRVGTSAESRDRAADSSTRIHGYDRGTTLSDRARAELLSLVGDPELTDQTPRTTNAPRTRLARAPRWLAPGLAAVLTVGGFGFAMTMSSDDFTPYAFADTLTATTIPGAITPIAQGTSLIFDLPYPTRPDQASTHIVERAWLAFADHTTSTTWGWEQVPDTVTFTLREVTDGVGYYEAGDWALDGAYRLIVAGPDSSQCASHRLADSLDLTTFIHGEAPTVTVDDPNTVGATTQFLLCDLETAGAAASWPTSPYDLAMNQTIAATGQDGSSAGLTTVEIAALTQDPAATIAQLKQFELGVDGQWISLPSGYEGWATDPLNQVSIQINPEPEQAGAVGSKTANGDSTTVSGSAPDPDQAHTITISTNGTYYQLADGRTCRVPDNTDLTDREPTNVTTDRDGNCQFTW